LVAGEIKQSSGCRQVFFCTLPPHTSYGHVSRTRKIIKEIVGSFAAGI
jgi:hypothetical protein